MVDSEKLLTLVVPLLSVVSWKTFPKASKRDETENLPKSAGYACQRIFVAFGKVNNSRG
jgi:hypothetical protein